MKSSRRTKEELLGALKSLNANAKPIDPTLYWNKINEISKIENAAFDREEEMIYNTDHMNERFTI